MLDLRLMPTDKCIAAYYKDLLVYQKTTPASRGSVSIVASYVEARNQLDFTCGSLDGAEDLSYACIHVSFHVMYRAIQLPWL